MIVILTSKYIYLAIAIIGVIFITLMCVLIITLVRKKRFLKNIEEMKNIIEDDHHDFFQTYFNKLRRIAENNEKYQEIYQQMSTQGEKLLTTDKENLISQQILLSKRCKIEKINKNLIETVKEFSITINQYKKDLNQLEESLINIFAASDKLRIRATELAKKYRSIQDDINTYQNSLQTCYENLLDFTMDIGGLFDFFEDYMKNGLYEEASKKLDQIEQKVYLCYGNIETIAQYNNMLTTIIPNQIKELEAKNLKLQEDGYVVSHARVDEFIANANKILDDCKIQFSQLYFADFKDFADEIQRKIAEVWQKLDDEVAAKKTLDDKYAIVNEKISQAENELIKTKRQFTTVNEYYKLSPDIIERYNNYVNNATNLSDLKREYQSYLFANTPNPATFMLEKENRMEELADSVLTDITFLTNHFKELKNFVEETYSQVDKLGALLITSLGMVRANKCNSVYNKYRPIFDSLINDLQNINNLLHEKPINIEHIHNLFGPLTNAIEENRVKMINEMKNYFTVEKCLIYANPLRLKFNDVDNILKEVEKCFVEGNYEEANEKLKYVLNNYHVDVYEAFTR